MVRILTTVFVWAAGAAMSLAFAAETTVGRTFLSVTENHGLHTGDVTVVAVAAGEAIAFTVVIWTTPLFATRRAAAQR
jgi:hypothetical protein